MKYFIIAILICSLVGCQRTASSSLLQIKVDSLQSQLNNTYKPGLGEFMNGVQLHHAKLWFAGSHQNWKLAAFEVREIEEALEDIQKFNADRPEVKVINMILPPIDSVGKAIGAQDVKRFERSFDLLTASCNSCHLSTNHAFNVIIRPTQPPVTNQKF